ncbi:MAG: DNA primase [Spirochaetia bacterium]|nr:DNA primase [Spirochaetia bacterium]
MKIPEHIIEEIKNKLSMYDVVSEYVSLQKKGSRLWGLCPFHNEKTPSFTVDEEKGLYYCYGCHKGGSIFNFIMEMESLGFVESVKLLAQKADLEISLQGEEDDNRNKEIDALYELYKRLHESFHYILKENDAASDVRAYLAERKISENEISNFKLGFVPDDKKWLYRFLKKKNYSESFMEKTGLFSKKYPAYSLFTGRLIIPIIDNRNRVVAFGGRALKDDSFAKYINSPETPIFKKRNILFGINIALPFIRKEKYAILSEGYFDVIALHSIGYKTAVAPLGTAFTHEHAQFLKRFCSRVLILFDQDTAGIDAAVKTMPILEEFEFTYQVITLPEGNDPADLVKEEKSETLKKCLKYPINGFEYLVKTLVNSYDVNLPEGKESVFQELLPVIKNTNSEIRKDEYLRRAAETLRLDVRVIYDDFNRRRKPDKRNSFSRAANLEQGKEKKIKRNAELYIMTAFYADPKLFRKFRNELHYEMLNDEFSKDLYVNLEDAFRNGIQDIDIIISRINNPDLRNFIIAELESSKYASHLEQIIQDGINSIKRKELMQKRRDIVQKIAQLEKKSDSGSVNEIQELLFEKKFLDEEIEKIRKII